VCRWRWRDGRLGPSLRRSNSHGQLRRGARGIVGHALKRSRGHWMTGASDTTACSHNDVRHWTSRFLCELERARRVSSRIEQMPAPGANVGIVAYVCSRIMHRSKPYCYNIAGNDERAWLQSRPSEWPPTARRCRTISSNGWEFPNLLVDLRPVRTRMPVLWQGTRPHNRRAAVPIAPFNQRTKGELCNNRKPFDRSTYRTSSTPLSGCTSEPL
jgi:hypothetical protein